MIEEINLDKIRRAIMVKLDPLAVNLQLDWQHKLEAAVLTIIYELTCTRQKPYVVRYPETWWQMFKESYAPAWFKKHWPVRFKEIKMDVTLLYPYLKSQVPRELMGQKITLMVRGKDRDYLQSFDPDTPEPVLTLSRRVRDVQSICDPNADQCPTCGRQIPPL